MPLERERYPCRGRLYQQWVKSGHFPPSNTVMSGKGLNLSGSLFCHTQNRAVL